MKLLIRTIIVFFISLGLLGCVFSRGKKDIDPKILALEATPKYEKALESFEAAKFNIAYKRFKRFMKKYPNVEESADAQYYLGRSLEEIKKPFKAFKAYQKVIDNYPNSTRIDEIVEREFKIGAYYLSLTKARLTYEFVDHPTVDVFTAIADKSPYSKYAPQALYKLGILLIDIGRYLQAKEAFQRLLDNYPQDELYPAAKYQLAMAVAKGFRKSDYDSTSVEEATQRLNEFIEDHSDTDISSAAQANLDFLKDMEAKKNFDIAGFYERQKKYESALLYYDLIVDDYSNSQYNDQAQVRIDAIKKMPEGQ